MDKDPLDRDPNRQRPPDRDPQTETPKETPRDPPEGTCDLAARQEVTSYRDTPVDRQTPVKILPCQKLRLQAIKIHPSAPGSRLYTSPSVDPLHGKCAFTGITCCWA